MFAFNFNASDLTEENGEKEKEEKENAVSWLAAKQIDVPKKLFKKSCESLEYVTNSKISGFILKLIDQNKVLIKLKEENCENIIEAESKHSDLLPAKYEGGLKVWECTYDLADFLLEEQISLNNKKILDLGCGAGIVGLIAFLRGSIVHFQDYNAEVIESFTIPNIICNSDDHEKVMEKCQFYSGDWESFTNDFPSNEEDEKYDFIFTSETIYNPDNHKKLYNVFKQKLKKNGIGYIAGKIYYFGVGGGMRQFEELVSRDGVFKVTVIWKSTEGLQREILKLERKS